MGVRGTGNPKAKLTPERVQEIRTLYATGEYPMRALSERFGVSIQAISKVVRRLTWGHVP